MEKIDLVLQGPSSAFTEIILDEYGKLPFVNNIILSTYSSSLSFDVSGKALLVDNDLVEKPHPGITNRNLQILTSRNGLKLSQTNVSVKMRADQLIRYDSMLMMYDYWQKNKKDKLIFTLGMYKIFPYHPRDHLFWGNTEDLKYLFNIPFDSKQEINYDYDWNIRSETYIGQFYYSRFNNNIKEHIDQPKIFLCDKSPKREEALELDYSLRDSIFKPFPKISMKWPKYNLEEYHYNIGSMFSEYWGNQ
jgi:hypothetical protein